MTWSQFVNRWRRWIAPVLLCGMLGLPASLSGCSSFSSNAPPLPDSTFSRLLVELHLLSTRAQRADGQLPTGIRDSLFNYYDVAPREFETTLRHFSRHPKKLQSIYDSVIDSLNSLEQRSRVQQYSRKKSK